MLSAHLDNFKIFSILIAKWRGFLDTLKFNESSIVIIRKSLEIYFITKRENVFFLNRAASTTSSFLFQLR